MSHQSRHRDHARAFGTGAFSDYVAAVHRGETKPRPRRGGVDTRYRNEAGRDEAAEARWYGEGGNTQT
jgi:hypothetical protein